MIVDVLFLRDLDRMHSTLALSVVPRTARLATIVIEALGLLGVPSPVEPDLLD